MPGPVASAVVSYLKKHPRYAVERQRRWWFMRARHELPEMHSVLPPTVAAPGSTALLDGILLLVLHQDPAAAVPYLEQAARRHPSSAFMASTVAIALMEKGDGASSHSWLQEALRRRGGDAFATASLGGIREEAGCFARRESPSEQDPTSGSLGDGVGGSALHATDVDLGEAGRAELLARGSTQWREAVSAYVKMHRRMVGNARPGNTTLLSPDGRRFLVCIVPSHVGLGNRVMSLISAFVVAVLTNRALLV